MDIDIVDFLPKYPNVIKKDVPIFDPYKESFYEAIYKKKEFYDLKLDTTEEVPTVRGDLMNHQQIIARFFSSYTPYDSLFLIWDMGTGKTCAAIGAIEQIKRENMGFRRAYIFANGQGLLNNFINEIVLKCTDGRYIPEDYEKLTELEKTIRKKKKVSEFYSFNTFETMAKEIKRIPDAVLKERYNNSIIVMDEIHNIRIQDKDSEINKYKQFHRFLHVVKNCKVLLLSGTPMRDGPEEIASVFNLILPLDQQLPTGSKFIAEYLDQHGENLFHVKKSKVKDLKNIFKGRISFMKAMQSNVPKIYEGEHIGELKHLKVVPSVMLAHQAKFYTKAYEEDKMDHKGVYNNSRQASLFVFPDGSYGKKGWDKYVITSTTGKSVLDAIGKKVKIFKYKLSTELKNSISGSSNEEKLKSLSKYSKKYADTIRNLLKAHKEKRKSFVYGEFVTGSGIILFSLILGLFGFDKAEKSNPKTKKLRYALITNLSSTPKEIETIINNYNQPENIYGEYISVIIGSSLIAEGFSFYNVQNEEILTPWFNYSQTSQAIARGLRVGSHRMLEEAGVSPSVRIYQRVSIVKEDITPSIDLIMYQLSEDKDITTEYIKRLMKVVAVDCALSYNRNHTMGKDGERECEYMDCDYVCDGIPSELLIEDLKQSDIDYSTYNLYYKKPVLIEIVKRVKYIFRDKFHLSFITITEFIPNFTSFELLSALRMMINESIVIMNMYGFPSYLREENNNYFLVDSLSVIGKLTSEYYTKNPVLKDENTFFQIVNTAYFKTLPILIRDIFNSTDSKELGSKIAKLPPDLREDLLEGSILAFTKDIAEKAAIRTEILDYFKGYYGRHENVWVSWYETDFGGDLRCLEDDKWKDCSDEYDEIGQMLQKKEIDKMIDNDYGFYGQYNPETDEFCIRDVRTLKKGKKATKGIRCATSINRDVSTDMAINIFKIPLPDPSYRIADNRKKLWKAVQANRYLKKMFKKEEDIGDDDEMRRILYFGSLKKEALCDEIKKWMDSKGLIMIDHSCGKQGRKAI